MHLTLVQSETSSSAKEKKKATKLQALFEKLWKRVQKQKKHNTKLRSQLDELSERYRSDILPLELEAKTPVFSLIERLTDFYSRKSMALWQREELTEWIM